MAKAIHMMVRVLDEARSVDFYKKAFDLGVEDRFEFDGFTLVYLKNAENGFEVELTINHGRTEPYTHGDGYGHLAVSVADVETRKFQLLSTDMVAVDAAATKFLAKDPAQIGHIRILNLPGKDKAFEFGAAEHQIGRYGDGRKRIERDDPADRTLGGSHREQGLNR